MLRRTIASPIPPSTEGQKKTTEPGHYHEHCRNHSWGIHPDISDTKHNRCALAVTLILDSRTGHLDCFGVLCISLKPHCSDQHASLVIRPLCQILQPASTYFIILKRGGKAWREWCTAWCRIAILKTITNRLSTVPVWQIKNSDATRILFESLIDHGAWIVCDLWTS